MWQHAKEAILNYVHFPNYFPWQVGVDIDLVAAREYIIYMLENR